MFTNRYPKITAASALESPELPPDCPCCGASTVRLFDGNCEASYYLCAGYYAPVATSPDGLPVWGGVCGRPDLAAIAAMPTASAKTDKNCLAVLGV